MNNVDRRISRMLLRLRVAAIRWLAGGGSVIIGTDMGGGEVRTRPNAIIADNVVREGVTILAADATERVERIGTSQEVEA